MKNQKKDKAESPYISPRELTQRWQCSRSTVDRIARQAGLTKMNLGEGPNGLVRYIRKEVLALEEIRQITLKE